MPNITYLNYVLGAHKSYIHTYGMALSRGSLSLTPNKLAGNSLIEKNHSQPTPYEQYSNMNQAPILTLKVGNPGQLRVIKASILISGDRFPC